MRPDTSICPLKIKYEGTLSKIKMRKSDLGKSTYQELESCRPSIANTFDYISDDIRVIRQLVSIFPQGLGEPSITRHSYVSGVDYDKY